MLFAAAKNILGSGLKCICILMALQPGFWLSGSAAENAFLPFDSSIVRLNYSGWTIEADQRLGLLNVANDKTGALLHDIRLHHGDDNRLIPLTGWKANKADKNLLIVTSLRPAVNLIFQVEEDRLVISASSPNIVLTGQAPAPKDRIIAHLLDPGGTPVVWSGTNEIEENFGGTITRNASFLSSKDPEMMSFALGQTDGRDIHSLFDRQLDIGIDFSDHSLLQRNSNNPDLMDVSIPVRAGAVLRLLPDYYTRTLGLPVYSRFNDSIFAAAPMVWSSWTSYYQDAKESDIIRNIDWLSAHLKPYGFQYVQIDDGYDKGSDTMQHCWIDNWDKRGLFPRGPKWIADYIKSKGLHPGLWLVPNVYAGAVKEHPEWYVRDTSGHLILDYFTPALDYTNPGTLDWLKKLFRTLTDWGFEYFKFDGEFAINAYAPLVDKSRLFDKEADQVLAYRRRLKCIRDVIGPRVFIEGCPIGAPLDGIGYINSYFNGADVYNTWLGSYAIFNSISGNAFMNHIVSYTMPGEGIDISPPKSLELARKTMGPRFLYTAETSEDSLKSFGVSLEQARTLVSFVSLTGVAYPLASIMPELTDERVQLLKKTMPTLPIMPVDLFSRGSDMGSYTPWEFFKHRTPDTYVHNYPDIINLRVNAPAGNYQVVSFTNWRSDKYLKTFALSAKLGLPEGRPCVAFDFWGQRLFGVFRDSITVAVATHDTKVVLLHPLTGAPQLIGNSRHITGAFSILDQHFNSRTNYFEGTSEAVQGDPYSLFFYVPDGYFADRITAVAAGSGQHLEVKKRITGRLLQMTFAGQASRVRWRVHFRHAP